MTAALATPAAEDPARAPMAVRAELCASCLEQERRKVGRRAVVTTTGKNRKGIVANIARAIADAGGDILDISQTLVADYFTMIIVIDLAGLDGPIHRAQGAADRDGARARRRVPGHARGRGHRVAEDLKRRRGGNGVGLRRGARDPAHDRGRTPGRPGGHDGHLAARHRGRDRWSAPARACTRS